MRGDADPGPGPDLDLDLDLDREVDRDRDRDLDPVDHRPRVTDHALVVAAHVAAVRVADELRARRSELASGGEHDGGGDYPAHGDVLPPHGLMQAAGVEREEARQRA